MAKKYNEALLRPGQRQAAELLLVREFAAKGERQTDEEIAEECGVTRMTLYNWRTKDENFIAYYQHRVDVYMRGQFGFVMRKLHDGISAGSMKGIELYVKMAGLLIDKSQVEVDDKRETPEETKRRLAERLAELAGEDVEDANDDNE